MAYDDGDGNSRFRDLEDLATLVERYYAAPENMTVAQLSRLSAAVHAVAQGRRSGDVAVAELSAHLREQGLGNVPFGVVAKLVDAVAGVPAGAEAGDTITLAQAQKLLGR